MMKQSRQCRNYMITQLLEEKPILPKKYVKRQIRMIALLPEYGKNVFPVVIKKLNIPKAWFVRFSL